MNNIYGAIKTSDSSGLAEYDEIGAIAEQILLDVVLIITIIVAAYSYFQKFVENLKACLIFSLHDNHYESLIFSYSWFSNTDKADSFDIPLKTA